MAIFSGKVVSAQFIDSPNNMLIEVLYREGENVVPFILEVDFTQQDFSDLLQEITLEEIEKNTKVQLKIEQDNLYKIIDEKVSEEIERRWANESEKVKGAYDKAEEYAQEIIERESEKIKLAYVKAEEYAQIEYQKINEEYKKVNEEYQKVNEAWEILKQEYEKLDNAWSEVEKESGRIEKSWEMIQKESGRIESSWKEIEGESSRVQSAWEEIRKGYDKVDEYAEGEKSKKMQEVQEEFQKLRQDLAIRFNTDTSTFKLDAKDIFQQLSGNEENKDFVFNLKIAILEDPTIAKSKDKNMKLAIRKSKSVTELLAIYYAQKAA